MLDCGGPLCRATQETPTEKVTPVETLPLSAEAVLEHLCHPTDTACKITPAPALLATLRKKLAPYDLETYFFLIRFAPGEVIMPEGGYSGYAALLLQGRMRVYRRHGPTEGPPVAAGRTDDLAECWNRPRLPLHRLEGWALEHTDRLRPDAPPPRWPTRVIRLLARRVRGMLGALEDWVGDVTRPGARRSPWQHFQGWVARTFCRWLGRRPHERWLANPLELGPASAEARGQELRAVPSVDDAGLLCPVLDRLQGVPGALWNTPRAVTLQADPDAATPPCEVLLIRREVLAEIAANAPEVARRFDDDFLDLVLPTLLTDNRLFRDTLYESDVTDWPAFLGRLKGARHGVAGLVRRRLDPGLRRLMAATAAAEDRGLRHRLLGALNELLKDADLSSGDTWPEGGPTEEVRGLRQRGPAALTVNETIRLNHLLLAAALPDCLRPAGPPPPLTVAELRELVGQLRAVFGGVELLHHGKDQVISQEGEPSEHLGFLISGTVRATRRAAGGEILVNQYDRHGFLGVSSAAEGAAHTATVRAVTPTHLVRLNRAALTVLLRAHPFVARKLQNEQDRNRTRDRRLDSLELLPPRDPPQEVASKLLAATNLLRIDMDLCTRCDQCVQACAEAHDGMPRFQRSNPDLHFGKWTVAAACVHCSDAPCQDACPVGAISFVEKRIVQIHMHRCIGCEKCVPACPFDVIHMEPPPTARDAAPTNSFKKRTGLALVATKCDLCLTDRAEPPCVASCPYGAAARGAPRDLFPGIKNWSLPLGDRP